jgi:peptide/nickel transport system substrate-binding protein
MERNLSRREFLKLSTVTAAGLAIAACTKTEEPTKAPEATKAPDAATATPEPVKEAEAKEAPMLAELVKAGSLPPLAERQPVNPVVVPCVEMTGQHGGVLNRGFSGVSDRWGPQKMIRRAMVWFEPDLSGFYPYLIESWDVNSNGTVWTINMRKGVKFRDGEPLTTDSVKWWWENVVQNEDLTTSPPGKWSTGSPRVLADVTFEDDYTFVITFANPSPRFIMACRSPDGFAWQPFMAEYYMQQFHQELTDDKAALEKAVTDAGFETWVQYFEDRASYYLNPDLPLWTAWTPQNALSTELFEMARNPYHFAVDKEGQQLPYIDKIYHRLHTSLEVWDLWLINGEIDFQARRVGMGRYTLLKENEAKGDYRILLGTAAGGDAVTPNQTAKDPRVRELFQDRRVRFAMNFAVDRDLLNELFHDGLYILRQVSPVSQSPNYDEKYAFHNLEYDVEKANGLLDEAGYADKDADGFRLWKDGSGETLSFVIEGTVAQDDETVLKVIDYYHAVGLNCNYNSVERSLYTEHFRANELDCVWWGTGGRALFPILDSTVLLGTQPDRGWGVAWGLWRTSEGKDPNAEEPPEGHYIRELWRVWDEEVAEVADWDEANEAMDGIFDIWAKEIPIIGYSGEVPYPCLIKNGLHNMLDGFAASDTTADEHVFGPETLFWDNPEDHM